MPKLGSMFEKRLRAYRGIGYAPGGAPAGYGDPAGYVTPWKRPSVEYDQAPLRSLKHADDSM